MNVVRVIPRSFRVSNRAFVWLFSAFALGVMPGCMRERVTLTNAAEASRGEVRLILTVYFESVDLLGRHVQNPHQYYVRYLVPETASELEPASIVNLPVVSGYHGSAEEFIIARDGERVLRVREIRTVLRDDLAYASAEVDVLGCQKPSGRWEQLATWDCQRVLISPSGTRMVAEQDGHERAFDLTAEPVAQLTTSDDLRALLLAAGSKWAVARPDVAAVDVDSRPDYLGLTDDLEYASVDGGDVYAGFIYDKTARRKLPTLRKVAVDGSAWPAIPVEVRKVRGEWQYLLLHVTADSSNFKYGIANQDGRVMCWSPTLPAPRGGSYQHSWNAEEGILMLRDRAEHADGGSVVLQMWNYRQEVSHVRALRCNLQLVPTH